MFQGRTKFWFAVLFIAAALAGCLGSPVKVKDPTFSGEGQIAITLTRGSKAVTTFAAANDQRTVESILKHLIGYRIRIEGANVDVLKDAIFPEGEDEMTIVISVPAGENYSVSLLALAPAPHNFYFTTILGGGMTQGVNVTAGGVTTVEIPMNVFQVQLDTPKMVNTGETIRVVGTVTGPKINEWLYPQAAEIFYSFGMDGKKHAKKPSEVSYADNKITMEFNLPGQSETGEVYVNLTIPPNTLEDWGYYSGNPVRLFYPDPALGEPAAKIQVVSGGSLISIKPIWPDSQEVDKDAVNQVVDQFLEGIQTLDTSKIEPLLASEITTNLQDYGWFGPELETISPKEFVRRLQMEFDNVVTVNEVRLDNRTISKEGNGRVRIEGDYYSDLVYELGPVRGQARVYGRLLKDETEWLLYEFIFDY